MPEHDSPQNLKIGSNIAAFDPIEVKEEPPEDDAQYHVVYLDRRADVLRDQSFCTLDELASFVADKDIEVEVRFFQGKRISFGSRKTLTRLVIDGKEFIKTASPVDPSTDNR